MDFARGPASDGALARPSLIALLCTTLVLYVWGLDRNGWGDAYYSAAVQAGTKSWTAFFFGSLDASSFISVDKTPAFLWVMEISARIFGVNSGSILVPQALEGVATVALTYMLVHRWFGSGGALVAGSVVALTPVAALMFRYNHPDALLVLLVTAGAYATLRAVEGGRTRWLILAAALIGTAFLAKMLEAFLIVPVLAAVYLVAGRPPTQQRIRQLVIAGITLIVASGWWVAVVELWPSAARPYVGGSQTNSIVEVILGYEGFGRLTGIEAGRVVVSTSGPTGWGRMFTSDFGGQVSWLIPAALILLAAGLWFTRGAERTDIGRAALVLLGGWLVVTIAVFSFAQGIIHPYYTIALAPPIGALTGAGASMLWRRRQQLSARYIASMAIASTTGWSYGLLERSSEWHPELRAIVLIGGLAAAVVIVAAPAAWSRTIAAAAAAGLALSIAGPAAYTIDTVSTAYGGAVPWAGPHVASAYSRDFPNSTPPGSKLTSVLQKDRDRYRWVAAMIYSDAAAAYELATGDAVMAIGGFNGTDPVPTLADFQKMVSEGKIHYFVAGGLGPGLASGSPAIEINTWVSQSFTGTVVDGVPIYDLTQAGS